MIGEFTFYHDFQNPETFEAQNVYINILLIMISSSLVNSARLLVVRNLFLMLQIIH